MCVSRPRVMGQDGASPLLLDAFARDGLLSFSKVRNWRWCARVLRMHAELALGPALTSRALAALPWSVETGAPRAGHAAAALPACHSHSSSSPPLAIAIPAHLPVLVHCYYGYDKREVGRASLSCVHVARPRPRVCLCACECRAGIHGRREQGAARWHAVPPLPPPFTHTRAEIPIFGVNIACTPREIEGGHSGRLHYLCGLYSGTPWL